MEAENHSATFFFCEDLYILNFPFMAAVNDLIYVARVLLFAQCDHNHTAYSLAKVKLLTGCCNSILMSFLAQGGKKGGHNEHKPPAFLFHF